MNQEELNYIAQTLQEILNSDKSTREGGEQKLRQIKSTDPDKYACYLVSVLGQGIRALPNSVDGMSEEVKSLAAVVLRRNISQAPDSQDVTNPENNKNIWERISPDAKEFVKTQLIQTVNACQSKQLCHKICNLIIEVGGSLYEQEEVVWQDMLNLVFNFVNSDDTVKIDAALQIFNGLFSYMLDYLVKFKNDLLAIFQKTMQHPNLDVNLASVQALSNYLQTAEEKDTKDFIQLIQVMVQLVLKAVQEDDETVLEDLLIEFNEIAEIEPRFFKRDFKLIFQQLSFIVGKGDFTNPTIRHQPLEFFVTIVERTPAVIKKDEETLRGLLDLIFKLMIDIDSDIDQAWMCPKEGFKPDEEEEESDQVHFGKNCVDRIVSSVGEEQILPLLSTLVQNTISNTTDWRYKNAGLMAFSQVGEYIDDIKKIEPMIPVVVQHLQHTVPKIRFAALHCLGQIADDMTEEFQETFHQMVLPALVAMLDDPVPRVQAHACAALTNFFEGSNEEIVKDHIQTIVQKLSNLLQNGISLLKENAATALASLAEASKEYFIPYFNNCIEFLCAFLPQFNEPHYKQFKGQIIEAITIVCASVGLETFRPQADRVVYAILEIQTKQLDSKDPQRTYLLSAWQRICLLMKKEFAKYLDMILPSLFQMATLNPEMSVAGVTDQSHDLVDVLNEVKPDSKTGSGATTHINIVTDEIEEKDVAIQMLSVFVEELGGSYYNYIEQTQKILLALISYEANDSIRNSVAGTLPGLIKCIKEANPNNQELIVSQGRLYIEKLFEVMKVETETETMSFQVQSLKDIIDEVGSGLMTQQILDTFTTEILLMYSKSDERINENNSVAKKGNEEDFDEDEAQDEQALVKEENKLEYDLQLSISELLGVIFKTHKHCVGNLLQKLFQNILPQALQTNIKDKIKFVIFILDDMVEYLGPEVLGQFYSQIAEQIIRHCGYDDSSIRQAAAYGVGMLAQHGGGAFEAISNQSLTGLKNAIEYQMPAAVKGKKQKEKKYQYAKENAISALGKVIRYQSQTVDYNSLLPGWIDLLPLKHDSEEAMIQNEILGSLLQEQPKLVLGEQNQRFEKVILILGEMLNKKYVKEETAVVFAQFLKHAASVPELSQQFQVIYDNKLGPESKQRIQEALNA